MANDYSLDVQKNVANEIDGTHAMIRALNSLGQKIRATNERVVNRHCSAHQAALSAADESDCIAEISEMEAQLLAV